MNPESYLPSFRGSCYLFTLLFLCPLVRKEISECLDFLVGLQSVGLDGPGVVPKFFEDHLFAARTVVVEKIGQPEMCGQDYPDVAISYSLAGILVRIDGKKFFGNTLTFLQNECGSAS